MTERARQPAHDSASTLRLADGETAPDERDLPAALAATEAPDASVSYSRKDGGFVRRLHAALSDRGRDVWVDSEDNPSNDVPVGGGGGGDRRRGRIRLRPQRGLE